MKKIIFTLSLVLLVACNQMTLEDKMLGQWVIVERRGVIEGDDGDYTEIYSTVNLETEETTEYERKNKDASFTVVNKTSGREALVFVEFTESQKIVVSNLPSVKSIYDITYFDDYIKSSLNYTDFELTDDTSMMLGDKTSIRIEGVKMINETIFDQDGYKGILEIVLVRVSQ